MKFVNAIKLDRKSGVRSGKRRATTRGGGSKRLKSGYAGPGDGTRPGPFSTGWKAVESVDKRDRYRGDSASLETRKEDQEGRPGTKPGSSQVVAVLPLIKR